MPYGRAGVLPSEGTLHQPNTQLLYGRSSWSGPHSERNDGIQQNDAVAHTGSRQSQSDLTVLDGTFLPGAPRITPAHSASADTPFRWPGQKSHAAAGSLGMEDTEHDPTVLRSLGKAWLNRSKLQGMVRQLKGAISCFILTVYSSTVNTRSCQTAGSLLHGSAQGVNATEIVAKLNSIDQMLDELPEIQRIPAETGDGPTSTSMAEVLPIL